jgi:phosphoribosyl 1,2-cyclic phosphodiesterase
MADPATRKSSECPAAYVDVLSSAGGRSSAYLLRHQGTAVLVDCGPGTAVSLARSGWLDHLDAIVITHEHADHAADIIRPRLCPPVPRPPATHSAARTRLGAQCPATAR